MHTPPTVAPIHAAELAFKKSVSRPVRLVERSSIGVIGVGGSGDGSAAGGEGDAVGG